MQRRAPARSVSSFAPQAARSPPASCPSSQQQRTPQQARPQQQRMASMSPDPANLAEPPPKAAEWIGYRERGSTGLLRFMAFLSLRLGRRISRAALYGIAAYFFLFAPGARRQSRRFLRRALGRAPSARDRFRHVLNFATTIHDRVYLINEQYDAFRITIEG